MAFQFTQPKWAATSKRCFMLMRHVVSIHAAQVGCESHTVRRFTSPTRFNSRSPSGLRLGVPSMVYSKSWFQFTQPKRAATKATSTTPSRRPPFQFTQPKRAATIGACSLRGTRCVSIHAAQAGCDLVCTQNNEAHNRFNSRSPSGLRLFDDFQHYLQHVVSIHAAQAGCDSGTRAVFSSVEVSIHAAQMGCDFEIFSYTLDIFLFQFTQPKWAATKS